MARIFDNIEQELLAALREPRVVCSMGLIDGAVA